jgi:hypothetical protein
MGSLPGDPTPLLREALDELELRSTHYIKGEYLKCLWRFRQALSSLSRPDQVAVSCNITGCDHGLTPLKALENMCYYSLIGSAANAARW